MIHDARYQYGRGFISNSSLPPIESKATQHDPVRRRNQGQESGSGQRRPSVVNPVRKVNPVIGAGTPTAAYASQLSNQNNLYAQPAYSSNNDLRIQIENDNFNGASKIDHTYSNGSNLQNGSLEGSFKSKRDLMWEKKKLEKLQSSASEQQNSFHKEDTYIENPNETTRDRIYRMKREKFLRDQERLMGKREDSSPTNDLYNFDEKTPPHPDLLDQPLEGESTFIMNSLPSSKLNPLSAMANDSLAPKRIETQNLGLFENLGTYADRPKAKFIHDIPQSTYSNVVDDEKKRLIKLNENTGGLFGTLGRNNDQQRYLERTNQVSPQNLNAPIQNNFQDYRIQRSPLAHHQKSPSPQKNNYNSNFDDEIIRKRKQQQEYARALEEQMKLKVDNHSRRHSDVSPYARRVQVDNYSYDRNPRFNNQFDNFESRQIAMRQQDYRRELDDQIRERQNLITQNPYNMYSNSTQAMNGPPIMSPTRAPPLNLVSTPTRRYSNYPSPSHHIDRVPMRHDLPYEEISKKITSLDTRTADERQQAMKQKQEYAQYLKQQMEEKKKREEVEKRQREGQELAHEFGTNIPDDLRKNAGLDQAPIKNVQEQNQIRDESISKFNQGQPFYPSYDAPLTFENQHSNQNNYNNNNNNNYSSQSPISPNNFQSNSQYQSRIDSPSKLSSPTNYAREGLLKYSEPAAVAEKQRRLEQQKLLKEKLDQQMREKKEREQEEKRRIFEEEERERLRYEKEQKDLKEQKEKEEQEKKRKTFEAEEESRKQSEALRIKADEERRLAMEEEKRRLESIPVSYPPQPSFSIQSNNLQNSNDFHHPTFVPPLQNDSLFGNQHESSFSQMDSISQPEILIPNSRKRPSRPTIGMISNNESVNQYNHRISSNDQDSHIKLKFQELNEKIEQYKQNDDQVALREQINELQKKYNDLEKLMQKKSLLDSRLNTPSSSRRLLDPHELKESHNFGPTPSQSSPTNQAKRTRPIPRAGRSEMLSINASHAFGQSIQAESEFLFPTQAMTRRSISRNRRSITRDISTDSFDSRPSTAISNISEAESEMSNLDTERLSKKNKYRMLQLEKLETVEDEAEKDKIMSQYLKTGKIDSERPQTTMSLPGNSRNILPSNVDSSDGGIPSILDDPFGESEAPVYKRIGSARSVTSETSEASQMPRPASRRSRRLSIASDISLESEASRRDPTRRRRNSIVEQSLSSHSQFLTTPTM